jgi:hypothetical protein
VNRVSASGIEFSMANVETQRDGLIQNIEAWKWEDVHLTVQGN